MKSPREEVDRVFREDDAPARELTPADRAAIIGALCAVLCNAARDVVKALDAARPRLQLSREDSTT